MRKYRCSRHTYLDKTTLVGSKPIVFGEYENSNSRISREQPAQNAGMSSVRFPQLLSLLSKRSTPNSLIETIINPKVIDSHDATVHTYTISVGRGFPHG